MVKKHLPIDATFSKCQGSPVDTAEVRLKWRVEAGAVQTSKHWAAAIAHRPYSLDTSGATEFRFIPRLRGPKIA